ncbi:CST, telomere maintenance, complex subunit CTC1-domain-containing protein [Cunninghamella echinulata]|nr:CST, telomere maintenance, complex subunit CTC1-domain-containing protein [Cunninghamella echinulata]
MISVNDIISGNSNLLTLQSIYGRLHIVNNTSKSFLKEYQRGTILLFDIYNTEVKILCRVDRIYHDLQDSVIEIPYWTLVTLKHHSYLEFSIESVKRLSNPTLTIQEEKNINTKNLLKILKKQQQHAISSPAYFCLVPRQLSQLKLSINHPSLNLLGYISAKSILYDKSSSEVVFFIELTDAIKSLSTITTPSSPSLSNSDIWSIPIVFKGDRLMKYYDEFQAGCFYIFNNLTPTTITSSISSHSYHRHFKRHILKYNVYQSSFIELSKKKYQSFYLSYHSATTATATKTAAAKPSLLYNYLHLTRYDLNNNNENNNLTKYEGFVTRIIDPLFGIYELNNEIVLCLFHYLDYSEKQPYHVGTYLVIHHAHMIALTSTTINSLLLNQLWKAPFVKRDSHEPIRIALVACMRSNIRIEITNNNDRKKKNSTNYNNNTSTIINMDEYSNMLFCNENNYNGLDSISFNHLIYKRLIYYHCLHHCHDFFTLLKHLELYASLQTKFPFLFEQHYDSNNDSNNYSLIHIGQCIIQSFFSHLDIQKQHFYHHGDIYGDFFQHGQTCLAMNTVLSMNDTTTSVISLVTFPTLKQVIISILNDSLDNDVCYKLKDIASPNRLSLYLATSCVNVTRYNYDTTTINSGNYNISCIIGIIDVLPDGRLYFKDDTYRILLIISNNNNNNNDNCGNDHNNLSYEEMILKLQLGHMYYINRFHLVIEDFSYSKSIYTTNKMEDKETKLEYKYIMCNWEDIEYVAPTNPVSIPASLSSTVNDEKIKSHYTLSIPLLDEDTRLRLCHFMIMDENMINQDIALYYIVDIMPASACNDQQGVLHLEQWVRAIRYNVTQVNDRHIDWDPMMVTLVFSSQFHSLSYTYAFKIGAWFGLSHVHQLDPFIIFPQAYPKIRNIRLQQHPTYFVDNDQYQFYSVIQQTKDQHLQFISSSSSLPSTIVLLSSVFKSTSNTPSTTSLGIWKENTPILTIPQFMTSHEEPSHQLQHQQGQQFNKNQLVNVRGLILFKAFIDDGNDDNDAVKLNKDVQLFQKLNIGFGKYGRQLFIRLRQPDGLQTLDIYMEHEDYQIIHTAGVIPGNIVTLFKVKKETSIQNKNIYGKMGCYTFIQVEPQLNPNVLENAITNFTDNIPMIPLISLHESSPSSTITADDVFKIKVTVRMILKLQLQWICKNCGTVISGEKCYNRCQHSGFLFRAEANIIISDGTSDAHAYINGEDLVFKLLMLLPNQESIVKLASLKHGTLSFGKYVDDNNKSNIDYDFSIPSSSSHHDRGNGISTLESLCKKVKRQGHYTMYGKRVFKSLSTNKKKKGNNNQINSIIKELGLRTVNIIDQDHTIQTLAFNHIKIKIMALESNEPCQLAWSLINDFT